MMDIGGHLRGLVRFSGRERRTTFWFWILICYGIQTAITSIAMQPMTADLNARMQDYVVTHPAGSGGSPTFAMRLALEAFPFRALLAVSAISLLVSVLLVAAAVTRRLHDTSRSGWWALPVVLFQFAGLGLFAQALTRFAARPEWDAVRGDMGMLSLVYVGGLLALIVLVVFCCQATHETTNRYGAAPGERVG